MRIEIEDDTLSADEPYFIVNQFKVRYVYDTALRRFRRVIVSTETVMSEQRNLGHVGEDWANAQRGYSISAYPGGYVPRNEPGWVVGAFVVHMEEDTSGSATVALIPSTVATALRRGLTASTGIPSADGQYTEAIIKEIGADVATILDGSITGLDVDMARLLGESGNPDDFGGAGVAFLITGADGRLFKFAGAPKRDRTANRAGVTEVTNTTAFSLIFPEPGLLNDTDNTFQGRHRVSGRMPILLPAWTRTEANGMGDVAVGPEGVVTAVGRRNGTIWDKVPGGFFELDPLASGFQSVARGPGEILWGVGTPATGGTLFARTIDGWEGPLVRGVTDVAVSRDGLVWIVRTNGRVAFGLNTFTDLLDVNGFRRVTVMPDGSPLGVGTNGTVWNLATLHRMDNAPLTQDATVSRNGRIWLAARDGSIWLSDDGERFFQLAATDFDRVCAAPDGSVWAVRTDGSLWFFSGDL